ncbi:MAG TPA: amino acid adenylation domain-containing protein, partial [Vicinamibacteria bacterium]
MYKGYGYEALAILVRDYESSGSFSLDVDFHCDLFSIEERARTMLHLFRVLDAVVENPEARIDSIDFLGAEERELVLHDLAHGEAGLPISASVLDLVEERVRRMPDRIAVRADGAELSYGELNRRANLLARALRDRGVSAESLVGLLTGRSLRMLEGLLGILKTGAAYVPLDPAYPRGRLDTMLSSIPLRALVIAEERPLESLPDLHCPLLFWNGQGCGSSDDRQEPLQPIDGENLAYAIFTSGTTGSPNAVGVPHRALAHYVSYASQRFDLTAEDRVLQFASISFDTAAEEIFPCLVTGGTLVLRPAGAVDSPAEFGSRCAEAGVTVLDLPTAYWHELASALAAPRTKLPPDLRLVIIGGERALAERFERWRGSVGDRVSLLNSYGPTEATIVATVCDLTQLNLSSTGGAVPIGRPIHRVQSYVLDSDLSPLPPGIVGRLYLGGAGLARGYLGRPEVTAARFRPNPFDGRAGARLYDTGDRCRWMPDGKLDYAGRSDHQVKVRGFRVELGEIEAALARHPGIRKSVVMAREGGSGSKRLIAYVVPQSSARLKVAELRSFLKQHLADYMVPEAFVSLEELPMLPSGKIDRQALPPPKESQLSAAPRY